MYIIQNKIYRCALCSYETTTKPASFPVCPSCDSTKTRSWKGSANDVKVTYDDAYDQSRADSLEGGE